MYIVPIFSNVSSKFIMTSELNEEVFRLSFYWNTREEYWYMSILDPDNVPLLMDIKLVPNYILLTQYKAYSSLPKGDFILYDLEQNPATGEATFDNLGKRYQLIFLSNEEIESGP